MDLLCEAGARDVSLLPYNSLGIEMAVSLGRPRPSLSEGFMKPGEKKEILALFREHLQEKGDASLMRQTSLSNVRPRARFTRG